MRVASYGIDDRMHGDGDWVAEPGETVQVTWEIVNDGLTYGEGLLSSSSSDPYLSTPDSLLSAGVIPPGDAGYCVEDIVISGSCPETHVGMLVLFVASDVDTGHMEAGYFVVGDLAFADDCESGEGVWTHSGSPDLWHLSSYRSHSDSTSWYFGHEGSHSYPSNADGGVISEDFIAGENNRLSCWFCYDFTTYGTDGVYVIVHTNGDPDTLDFVGSGGALDSGGNGALNIVSSWTNWANILTGPVPGDTVNIEFGFISDNVDVAEGMYIDDISFTCRTPQITGVDEYADEWQAVRFRVLPNPAREHTTIAFTDRLERVTLDIYTVEGRLTARLEKPAGLGSVTWDLKDGAGRPVAPGIYLAKVRGRSDSGSYKIVVLR
jgi:hypothetical protein